MKKFVKSIAAVCAAAILMGSVPVVSLGAGTDTTAHSVKYAESEENTKQLIITTEEAAAFDGVIIYAKYTSGVLVGLETAEFEQVKNDTPKTVTFTTDYTEIDTKLFAWNSLDGMVPYIITKAETIAPTNEPTGEPTGTPTSEPTGAPTSVPTGAPTSVPTGEPTGAPTSVPTGEPTGTPTSVPTGAPTSVPTGEPTTEPTTVPTIVPTTVPTIKPTIVPTIEPTAVPTYTVSFDAGTGADALSQSEASRQVTENEAVGAPPTLQNIKVNYAFAHWLSGQTQYSNDEVAALAVTQPLSFLAKYTITVTLDGNGGTFNSDATKAVPKLEGTALGSVDEPERAHYTFTGWKKGADDVDDISAETVTEPVTYTAQWEIIEHTVTFNLDGGKANGSTDNVEVTVNDGEKVTAPSVSRDGYKLNGWKKDNAAFDLDTEITEDITLVADWEEIPAGSYIVSFDLNGATGSIPAAQTITDGETATAPDPAPTREGYDFDGWLLNGTAYDFSTPVTSNITLVAKWDIKQYTITYDADGGEAVEPVTEDYNTTITLPAATKTGHTFAGWKDGGETFNANTEYTITSDKTLVAQWTKNKYTITWTDDNDQQIDTTQVEYGEIPTHADAEKAATAQYTYTFTGWNPQPVAVTGEATYKAVFDKTVNKYTVTWKSQDGNTDIEVDNDVEYGTQPSFEGEEPTKAATAQYSYTFAGWATEANKTTGTAAGELGTVSGDVTYYAAFSETLKTYTIIWKDGENTVETDEEVAYGATPEYNGEALIKTGYSYTWTPEITSVTGDATYTTNWTINKYTITNNSADDDGTKHGTISLATLDDDGKAEYNSTITVTPETDEGYELKKITVEADGTQTATYTGAANDGKWKFNVPAATAGAEVIVTATFGKIPADAITVEGASSFKKGEAAVIDYTAKVTAADGTDITAAYADEIQWTGVTGNKAAASLSVSAEQTDSMTVKASLGGLYDTVEVTPVSKITISSATALHNGNPGNAYDGNTATSWSVNVSSNGRRLTYITFELDSVKSVSSAAIYFANPVGRIYDFDIKVSADGTYWEKVGTYKSDGKTNGFEAYDFGKTVSAKYIRFVGRGSSLWTTGDIPISYVAINEFEVYGPDTAAAQPEKLTVSSAEANTSQGTNLPSNAYDDSLTTSWNASIAGNITKNILTFDLESKKTVSAVDISFYFGNQRSYNFDIETSVDGVNWNKAGSYLSGAETDKDYERFEFEAVNARYIRYVGDKASLYANSATKDEDTGIWYYATTESIYNAIWEFKIYGSDTAISEPAELNITLDGASLSTNDGPAANAVDGNMDTRWAADATAETNKYNTIDFDLGKTKRISAVGISFYLGVQRSYDFDILVSDDKQTWTKIKTLKSGAASDKALERFDFGEVEAQYVRYLGRGSTVLQNGTYSNFNSIWEFKVYGFDIE